MMHLIKIDDTDDIKVFKFDASEKALEFLKTLLLYDNRMKPQE
jgi:hypothetical protein